MLGTVQDLGDRHHETLPEIFTLECEGLDKFDLIEKEYSVNATDCPCRQFPKCIIYPVPLRNLQVIGPSDEKAVIMSHWTVQWVNDT